MQIPKNTKLVIHKIQRKIQNPQTPGIRCLKHFYLEKVTHAPSIRYDGTHMTIEAKGPITLYDQNGMRLTEGHDVLTMPMAKGEICLVVAGGTAQKLAI